MPQDKVFWPKHEIKMPQKIPSKIQLWKNNVTKMHFYILLSWNLKNQKCFFRSKVLLCRWKEKMDLVTSNNPNRESLEKNVLKRGEAWLNQEILHITIYFHLHKRKLLPTRPGLFFGETSPSLLLYNIDTSASSLFWYRFFFFNIETKLNQRIYKTQKTSFFTAHIVTQMSEVNWFHYFVAVSYDFITLLYSSRILLCKASWHSEERSSSLEFINQAVDSDDKDEEFI